MLVVLTCSLISESPLSYVGAAASPDRDHDDKKHSSSIAMSAHNSGVYDHDDVPGAISDGVVDRGEQKAGFTAKLLLRGATDGQGEVNTDVTSPVVLPEVKGTRRRMNSFYTQQRYNKSLSLLKYPEGVFNTSPSLHLFGFVIPVHVPLYHVRLYEHSSLKGRYHTIDIRNISCSLSI